MSVSPQALKMPNDVIMVQPNTAKKALNQEDPGLVLLGRDWKIVSNLKIGKDGTSRYYVNAVGEHFSSLMEAWKASGYKAGDDFLSKGHPWIGERVTRIFNGKPLDGKITSWLPPSGDDAALWHVNHDDGDSEDLEESEAEEALEEYFLHPNRRVEARFQGKWYPGVLRKVIRSKREPYGVKCDSDKNNSMLLWVPRRNVQLPSTSTKAPKKPIQNGQDLNRLLIEHKADEMKIGEEPITSRKNTPKQRRGTQKKAQAGRRKSKPSPSPSSNTEAPALISWNQYQRMHRGRQVTTSEWRKYVRCELDATHPMPTPPPAYASPTTTVSTPDSNRPSDGKRVRKKKINPDFLWGEELKNPKRALVAKLEGAYLATAELARRHRNDPNSAAIPVVDRNSNTCAVCRGRGDLLCCDGPCLRSFHLDCLGLKEEDLPDQDWFCKDCKAGRAPKPMAQRGRPRPKALQLDVLKKETKKETKKRPRGRPVGRPKSSSATSTPRSKPKPLKLHTPSSFPLTPSLPGSARSSRRGAGIPARFKDSYLTPMTPQMAAEQRAIGERRLAQSEPQMKRRKKGMTKAEETRLALQERLRALESFIEERKGTPKATTPLASSPPVLQLPPSDGLEPWRKCTACEGGRRSMTCSKLMCALCCRKSGACYTHTRFLPGDTLKVFKGILEGKSGLMVAKTGRIITIKVEKVGSSDPPIILPVDEKDLQLVQQGPDHAELEAKLLASTPKPQSTKKRKGASASRQCTKCQRRFRNRSALTSHQRTCLAVVTPGAEAMTPYGKGLVQAVRAEDGIAVVKLAFARAFLQTKICRALPKPPRKRARKTVCSPSPIPVRGVNPLAAPKMKRQKSLPLRYKKAQLSRTMLMCFELLSYLRRHKYGNVFAQPVPDTVVGYRTLIKKPMDLGTVETRLFEVSDYGLDQFEEDVHLIWANALRFNPTNHPVNEMALFLRKVFNERFEKIRQRAAALKAKLASKSRPRKPTAEGLGSEVKKLAQKMEVMRKRLKNIKGGGGGGSRRPRPQPARPVTYVERQILKQQIMQLPAEDLTGVAELVRDATPGDDTTEVEIDLEALDTKTLRTLQRYVGACMQKLERSGGVRKVAAESSSDDSDSDGYDM